MPNDIPASDDKLDTYQSDFVDYVAANKTARGVTTDEVTALLAKQAAWAGPYATQAKDDSRAPRGRCHPRPGRTLPSQ